MSIKIKILFVQTFRKGLIKNASQQTLEKFDQTASQFIQNDLDILRRFFDVRVAHYQGKKRLREFLIETLKDVLWSNLSFSWFADVHAFAAVLFSKIFRKKSIVVVGGYEVAKVQGI